MLLVAILLGLVALGLIWLSRRWRRASGLPGGRVIYSDTNRWGPVEEPLYDPELGLTGRPDYLVEQGQSLIPVEVKSGRIPDAPYDTHIFQLAAYCLLVKRVYGKRPPFGLIHYSGRSNAGRTFAIDYTPTLETALLDLLAEIRRQEKRKEVDRSHESTERCRSCGFRSVCDQRL
jgi:CRISPR-associated exonuclease Cas4